MQLMVWISIWLDSFIEDNLNLLHLLKVFKYHSQRFVFCFELFYKTRIINWSKILLIKLLPFALFNFRISCFKSMIISLLLFGIFFACSEVGIKIDILLSSSILWFFVRSTLIRVWEFQSEILLFRIIQWLLFGLSFYKYKLWWLYSFLSSKMKYVLNDYFN